jgi:glycosyltransferase involved in cell wall biosynthesis
LITVSSGLQLDIKEVGGVRPERMITIHNPYDLDEIRKLSRHECPMEGERFLLHVGRFNPVKRHDRLFEAFRLSKYPGKLVLLGGGNAKQEQEMHRLCLQMGVGNRVIFAGFTPNPYPYMRAAEALLLSSDSEGLPNVLIETLACGTPVVSTNCPYGPQEILIEDLARGLSELSAESLAHCLNDILSNPPVISPRLLDRFSVQNITNQYLALAGY